jgi:hypothetical protein
LNKLGGVDCSLAACLPLWALIIVGGQRPHFDISQQAPRGLPWSSVKFWQNCVIGIQQ